MESFSMRGWYGGEKKSFVQPHITYDTPDLSLYLNFAFLFIYLRSVGRVGEVR